MLCSAPTERVQRWWEHLDHVLNTPGQYSQATIDSFLSYDTHDDMVNTPTMDEVHTALRCIPGNKASDNSGILPEMVKVCSSNLLECLVKLFTHVWDSRSIPQDWKDVLLIPVLKTSLLSRSLEPLSMRSHRYLSMHGRMQKKSCPSQCVAPMVHAQIGVHSSHCWAGIFFCVQVIYVIVEIVIPCFNRPSLLSRSLVGQCTG